MPEKGVWSIICTNTGNGLQYTRETVVSYLYCTGFLPIIRAYNCETAFLALFVRRARLYFRVRSICKRGKNTRLKRVI